MFGMGTSVRSSANTGTDACHQPALHTPYVQRTAVGTLVGGFLCTNLRAGTPKSPFVPGAPPSTPLQYASGSTSDQATAPTPTQRRLNDVAGKLSKALDNLAIDELNGNIVKPTNEQLKEETISQLFELLNPFPRGVVMSYLKKLYTEKYVNEQGAPALPDDWLDQLSSMAEFRVDGIVVKQAYVPSAVSLPAVAVAPVTTAPQPKTIASATISPMETSPQKDVKLNANHLIAPTKKVSFGDAVYAFETDTDGNLSASAWEEQAILCARRRQVVSANVRTLGDMLVMSCHFIVGQVYECHVCHIVDDAVRPSVASASSMIRFFVHTKEARMQLARLVGELADTYTTLPPHCIDAADGDRQRVNREVLRDDIDAGAMFVMLDRTTIGGGGSDERWMRVVVTSATIDTIKLLCVDTGRKLCANGVSEMQQMHRQLRYLTPDFLDLPALAFSCEISCAANDVQKLTTTFADVRAPMINLLCSQIRHQERVSKQCEYEYLHFMHFANTSVHSAQSFNNPDDSMASDTCVVASSSLNLRPFPMTDVDMSAPLECVFVRVDTPMAICAQLFRAQPAPTIVATILQRHYAGASVPPAIADYTVGTFVCAYIAPSELHTRGKFERALVVEREDYLYGVWLVDTAEFHVLSAGSLRPLCAEAMTFVHMFAVRMQLTSVRPTGGNKSWSSAAIETLQRMLLTTTSGVADGALTSERQRVFKVRLSAVDPIQSYTTRGAPHFPFLSAVDILMPSGASVAQLMIDAGVAERI